MKIALNITTKGRGHYKVDKMDKQLYCDTKIRLPEASFIQLIE